jgi:DNA-binding MarR family transcriptional regulator
METSEQNSAMDESLAWLEQALPRIMRRLMDSENLDTPLLQLPLAQMRLAQALCTRDDNSVAWPGETMGRLSGQLGVRQNALSQAADRLVNHGLAERGSDASDRRIVRLRLTERGKEWVLVRRARRHDRFVRLWQLLDRDERAEFVSAVRVLEAAGGRLSPAEAEGPDTPIRDPITDDETLSRFTIGAANGATARVR